MGKLLDLFDAMERDGKERARLSSLNIETSLDYSLFREEGKNVFLLDGRRYEIPDNSTLFVRQDKVFVNNVPFPSLEEREEDDPHQSVERIRPYYLPREIDVEHRLVLRQKRKATYDDRIDKRIPLYVYRFQDREGRIFPVRVYRGGRETSRRGFLHYGTMELFCSEEDSDKEIASFVQYLIEKRNQVYFTPFYDEGTLFFFGRRKTVTTDSRRLSDPDAFVVAPGEHPIRSYKQNFFLYLKKRIVEIGDRMGLDLRRWEIKVNNYQGFFASNSSERVFRFDYRNCAFRQDIVDALIVHEVAHCYVRNHGKAFQALCRRYCPDYDLLDYFIDQGVLNPQYLSEAERRKYATR